MFQLNVNKPISYWRVYQKFGAGFFLALFVVTFFGVIPAASDEQADPKKALVIMIFDDKCKNWCSQVKPILGEIRQEYGEKISVYELDVSEKVLSKTMDTAKQLGVQSFVKGALDWVPTIGVFTAKRQLVRELPGVKKKEVIEKSIDKALQSG